MATALAANGHVIMVTAARPTPTNLITMGTCIVKDFDKLFEGTGEVNEALESLLLHGLIEPI
jgi:hypothetical protein